MAANTIGGLNSTITSGSQGSASEARRGFGSSFNPGSPGSAAVRPARGGGMGAIILEKSLGATDEASTMDAANDAATGPLLIGVATSAAGGAVVGGLAAGSWKGAAIGAGLNTAIWSLLTLGGAWSSANTTTKAILGGAVLLGGGVSGYYLYRRMKK